MLTPAQVEAELKKELLVNSRIAELLAAQAKNRADAIYRRTNTILDHASLVKLVGVAAGIEDFVSNLLPKERSKDRPSKE